jgi:protease-4
MRAFFRNLLASIVGFFISLFLLFGLFFIIAIAFAGKSKKQVVVKSDSVLKISLDDAIPEKPVDNPFAGFSFLSKDFHAPVSLKGIVDDIRHAKDDKNIKGIYLELDLMPHSLATLEEIRLALVEFKKSGKFIYAYAELYNQRNYYIASVADTIYMNSVGAFAFAGFHSEQMFLKGLFDKLDVQPKLIRAGKYKSAGETFTRSGISDANREQLMAYINSCYNDYLGKIAASRKMDVKELRGIADNLSVRTPADAVKYKLVDRLAYKDEVLSAIKKRLKLEETKNISFIDLVAYNGSVPEKLGSGSDKIALVYAVGEIGSGEGSDDKIGSEKLSETIRKARLDDNVKAIVLRINSPGGGALASDIIWREVLLAKKKKPVIVSMGDVAASGGYYIAAPANIIFAEPNTITGSIGVFALLPNLKKFWEKDLGITWDRIKTGRYADLGNPNREMLPEEEQIIQTYIDTTYIDFKRRVAEGRKLPITSVDSLAQGRIYSGLQALQLGLVDKLGNLDDAIAEAVKMAKLDKYRLQILPKYDDKWKQITRGLTEAKTSLIKSQLGDNYIILEKAKAATQNTGVMMLCPYELTIY